MPKFRIVNGEHSRWERGKGDVTYYAHKEGNTERNDVLEDERDLMAVFPNKFERFYEKEHDVLPEVSRINPDIALANQKSRQEAEKVAKDSKKAPAETPSKAPTPPAPSDASEFGSEVTEDFEDAADNGLRVFKKGNYFTVVEASDPAKALNDEKLTKGKVAGWIDTYVSGEEADDEDE